MPGRPRTNLHRKVKEVLSHTRPLPPESESPIAHYEKAANSNISLIKYVENHLDISGLYRAALDRHMAHMYRLVVANLIETFERFIKELAAICIDHVAIYVNDGRYDSFSTKGGQIVAHFRAGSIGKALCESDTWLNNNDINDRFRRILKPPSGKPGEFLFPNEDQHPVAERDTASTLSILWQIRHNLTHNSGVLTGSDSMKLRMLSKGAVEQDCILSPSRDDLRFVKRFLTETANRTNERVGKRLADLLTEIHYTDSTLFLAQEKADEISRLIRLPLSIAGSLGIL